MKTKTRVFAVFGIILLIFFLVPPVYHVLADRIDRDALNRRIAELEGTAITSPADLQRFYREIQVFLLPILPPAPDAGVNSEEGIVVFDPEDFPGWLEALKPVELHGVKVYPLIVGEDPKTRDTVFLNSQWEEIDSIPAEKSYDPFAMLATWKLDLFLEYAAPEDQAWYMEVYDPARISATFYLLPAESVAAMAEALLAERGEEEEDAPPMRMMMGEGMPEPTTNLVIFAIEKTTNGMALGIGWPEDFTNNLEVFARTNIASTGWFVASTNLSTAGTNSLWWVDTSISSNTVSRFYRVGNADQDSDVDGLTDARERMMYGTDEHNADTDDDGLTDREEVQDYFTAPLDPDTDKDGLTDDEEILTYDTNPLDPDTDDDGLPDGAEVHTCLGFDYRVETATNGWIDLPLTAETLRDQLPDNNEDDGAVSVSLGFVLPFFGTNCAIAEIGVNGLIELGSAASDGFSPWENESLPSPYPIPLIAAFWDDLCVFPEEAEILCATVGSGTSAVFLVEWRYVALVSDPDNTRLTFQAVLEKSGVIRVNFRTLMGVDTDGTSSTFGLQDAKGAAFCHYAYAQPGSVSNGLSLIYTPGWRFTNPRQADTDGDGVNDGDEAIRDHTDPLNPDRSPPGVHIATPANASRKVVVP